MHNKPEMERVALKKLIQHKIITIHYIYESCYGRNVYGDCSSSYLERAVVCSSDVYKKHLEINIVSNALISLKQNICSASLSN